MTAAAPESDPELDRLIAAMHEGRLSLPDRDRLERLLQQPEARGRYRKLSVLHASLLYLWHHPSEPHADRHDPAAASAHEAGALGPAKRVAPVGSLWPPAAFVATLYQCLRLLARPTPFSLTVATLTVGGVLAIAAAVRVGLPSIEESPPGIRHKHPVATLVAVHEVVWCKPAWPSGVRRGRAAFEIGDALAANERLRLERGLTELAFFSGARLVVEGPADIVITGRDSVRLNGGRIVVRTTHGPIHDENAALFTVATPRGRIDDLGTEFGVDVPHEGSEGVHVFDGVVSIVATGEKPASPGSESRKDSSAPMRLEAGASVAIDQNLSIRPVAHVFASRFVRAIPDADKKRRTEERAEQPRPPVWHGENVEQFGPVRARLVRFSVFEANDARPPCLDELEVFATDGRNVARNGTATASGVIGDVPIHAIPHVNDGLYGNDHSWICDAPRGWIQVELSEEAEIDRVVWSRDRTATPKYTDRVPTRYLVSVSLDGMTWRHVASSSNRLPFGSPLPQVEQHKGNNRKSEAEEVP